MEKEILTAYKTHIDKIIPISQEIWDELKAILSTRELKYSSLVVENELARKTQHEIFLLKKSAEERYMMFHKLYPHLENRISQYHIASYLGITPVSLSRLRKSLAKK